MRWWRSWSSCGVFGGYIFLPEHNMSVGIRNMPLRQRAYESAALEEKGLFGAKKRNTSGQRVSLTSDLEKL